MFSRHLREHDYSYGHGHGHNHRHGGRYEEYGPYFRHHGRHMDHEPHHRCAIDFERPCYSDRETKQQCCCEKNIPTTANENMETGEGNSNVPANTADNVQGGEQSNASASPTENVEKQGKNDVCCHHPMHHLREHYKGHCKGKKERHHCCQGGNDTENENISEEPRRMNDGHKRKHQHGHRGDMRGHRFWTHCPEHYHKENVPPTTTTGNMETGKQNDVPANTADNAETAEKINATTVNVEEEANNAGKRRHGFKTTCQKEGSTDEDSDGCINNYDHHRERREHGFWRHHPERFGNENEHFREMHDGHHGGRRGHRSWGYNPGHFANRHEHFWKMHEGKHHHGGKWGHGPHNHHHGMWRGHGYYVTMVDVAVNTDDPELQENVDQEVINIDDADENLTMEQDTNREVGQEQPAVSNKSNERVSEEEWQIVDDDKEA